MTMHAGIQDPNRARSRSAVRRETTPRYRLRFPPPDPDGELEQDEAFFFLLEDGETARIRFHDYGAIYRRPGLYEQLFYDRLKCQSPRKVSEVLISVLRDEGLHSTELRVLDLGAGNGMAGEALVEHGVARLVGADIEEEAVAALERDRPGLYDAYHVTDLTALDEEEEEELRSWALDCLCCIAALGFGDIPPDAFLTALNLVADDAWVAFNIKESFLNGADESGFSRMIRNLILSEHLHLYHLERYRHRLSMDGVPLHYFAIVARKQCGEIPPEVAGLA
jgi:predicted TPR repeat methyltransferase